MSTQPFTNVKEFVLQDCTAFEYILLGDLRDLLEEPPDRWTEKWLLAVLDALLQTLPQEFELRDENGYLSEVLEEFPNWSGHVNVLLAERRSLYDSLSELRVLVAGEELFKQSARRISRELRDWMARFAAYHRHERRLVQTAFNLDIGEMD